MDEAERGLRRILWYALLLGAAVGALLLLLWIVRQFAIGRTEPTNYAFVLLIGATVGATELMSRYRDAPFKPLNSIPGVLYMAVNAGAAILAYYLLGELVGPLSTDGNKAAIYGVLVAGLSAMTFFRSGVFTIRMSGSDVAVGPNLVMQILLQALDRTYDRIRAAPRSVQASTIMAGVDFDAAREALPIFCLSLMQNVSVAERIAVSAEVKSLAEAQGMSPEAKALNLGLAMLNVVGEDTLQAAVSALGGTIRGAKGLSVEMARQMAKLPPDRVVRLLPTVAGLLSGPNTRPMDELALVAIRNMDVPEDNKVWMMVYVLARHYGDQIVGTALNSLDEGEEPDPSIAAASSSVGGPVPRPSGSEDAAAEKAAEDEKED